MKLNYQMGRGVIEPDPNWPGPGEAYPLDYAEANQRGFHDRASKLYRRRNYGPEKVAEAMVDAVRHGIEPAAAGGVIRVRTRRVLGQVEIAIDNFGWIAELMFLLSTFLANAKVADLLTTPRSWTTIPAGADLETCRKLIAESTQDQFPVIGPDQRLLGVIDRQIKGMVFQGDSVMKKETPFSFMVWESDAPYQAQIKGFETTLWQWLGGLICASVLLRIASSSTEKSWPVRSAVLRT